MPDETKTWWEKWGRISGVVAITGTLIAAIITGGVRVSTLESRVSKVDDILQAMQELREVLIKNNIKWDPAEFPPIAPVTVSVQGRTVAQLDAWMKYCQAMLNVHEAEIQELRRQLGQLETKVNPYPLLPRAHPPVLVLPVDEIPESQ